jgi:hypothetical protein
VLVWRRFLLALARRFTLHFGQMVREKPLSCVKGTAR